MKIAVYTIRSNHWRGNHVYNKFQLELRYSITDKPSASIYALGFLEAGNTAYDNFKNLNRLN